MELLGKGGLLEDVKRSLRYSDWCGTFPFKWNDTKKQMEIKSIRKRLMFGCQLVFALVYYILAFIQNYSVLKEAPLMVVTHSLLFFATGSLILSGQVTNCVQLSGFTQLFNGFIQLENNFFSDFRNEYSRRNAYKTNLALKAMIFIVTFSGTMVPFVFALDILRNPCFPFYIGYWMSSQCEKGKLGHFLSPTWSIEEVLTKVLIAFGYFSIWPALVSGSIFQISLESIVEGNCFRVNIKKFEKQLLKISMDNTQGLMKLNLFYRQIQIMSIHYRLNVSQFRLGCAIPCLIAMQTACLYNSLSFISGKHAGGEVWYNLGFLWSEVVLTGMTVFVFGILADVYNVSNRTHKMINGRPELMKNKWVKMWFKSCPILKIYFGGSNFLDQLTPVNIQNFAINQTVSLMLLNH